VQYDGSKTLDALSRLPEKGGLLSNNLVYRYETGESPADSPVSSPEPTAPRSTRT